MEEEYLTDLSLVPTQLRALGNDGSLVDLDALASLQETPADMVIFSPDVEGDMATGTLYKAADGVIADGVPYTVTPRD
jgi:hypothetical protein